MIYAELLSADILPDANHRRASAEALSARWDETLLSAETVAAVADKWKTR
jgi:hypothetical protein